MALLYNLYGFNSQSLHQLGQVMAFFQSNHEGRWNMPLPPTFRLVIMKAAILSIKDDDVIFL